MSISTTERCPKIYSWPFPATNTHDGIPLGNGLFCALIWGDDDALQITINRADFWDHRGGVNFGPEATYENLKTWLAAGNETELRRVFEGRGAEEKGVPPRPSRMPMGKLEMALGEGIGVKKGSLDLATGAAQINLQGAAPLQLEAVMPRGGATLAMRLKGFQATSLTLRSHPADAPDIKDYEQMFGIAPSSVCDQAEQGGWTKTLPQDPALAVCWRRTLTDEGHAEFFVVAEYGDTAEMAWDRAQTRVQEAADQGYDILADAEAAWWRDYLQGPWVEEYRMPPWSSDYHFNINVQECYWPAYAGNQLQSLEPLWEMIRDWMPKLQQNAEQLLGIPDGLMLNHAVDDRCTCMGGFWTGSVDHGATSWVGQMMWLYYRYTLDVEFLAETAYPFIKGCMAVYEAMMEKKEDGTYFLPISVSPEYEGAQMWAWGANASFQLAIIHCLCRALIQAAKILGQDADLVAHWREIDAHTPRGSIGEAGELNLWDGQPLTHSHRHHSHLAGLYPFDVFDPWQSDADRELVQRSMSTWTRIGKGEWTGWCVPWASILWSRMHQGDRAALLLKEFAHTFRRAGKASTHDAVIPGWTVFDLRDDVMQIEATMAASAAVMEMLLHTASGVMHVFPGVPKRWDEASFDGLLTEGAFVVSAQREDRHTCWVRIQSRGQSQLRLASPFGTATRIYSTCAKQVDIWSGDGILVRDMVIGEVLYLVPEREHFEYEEERWGMSLSNSSRSILS